MDSAEEWRCPVTAVGPGRTAKFRLTCGRGVLEGFVVNHDGHLAGYVNRCPHVGTPLDLWPNEFLAEDGRTLVCATHGALFDPLSGVCTAGPCAGDTLVALAVRRDADTLIVRCPSSLTTAPSPPPPPAARRETS